jgi:hypothetical protein
MGGAAVSTHRTDALRSALERELAILRTAFGITPSERVVPEQTPTFGSVLVDSGSTRGRISPVNDEVIQLERELAAMKSLIALAVDCGEACGMDGAYPEAWEQMKAAAANTVPIPSADARDVIADLLANAVPVAAESGDAGMVFVEMTEAEWQRVVEATARAKAFLAK